MQFLDGGFQHRSGGSNILASSPTENGTIIETTDSSHEEEVLVRESADIILSSTPLNEIQNTIDKVTKTLNNKTKQQKKIKSKYKRLVRYNEDDLLKLWKERDEKRQSLMKSIMEKKNDDVDLFCQHIAEVLRNLPPVEKAQAKKHIGLLLSDYEILAARNLHGSTDNASTSSGPVPDVSSQANEEQ